MARQEKEARKVKQMIEKEQGMIDMVNINASEVDETREMSNTLNNIANNTTLF